MQELNMVKALDPCKWYPKTNNYETLKRVYLHEANEYEHDWPIQYYKELEATPIV